MKKNILAIITAIILFAACTSKIKEHTHEHESGHLMPLSYTLYSEKTELFVEFKPLVAGNLSKFAAHFTILGEKFLPLSEGIVTVSILIGEKEIKHTANTPNVPGIYNLFLKPTVAGTGKLVFDIKTKDFSDQLIIDNIKVYADKKSAIEEQYKESGKSKENELTYLKEQAWKVEFANTPVIRQAFSNVIKTNGQIFSAPGDEIIVTAKTSGIVLFSGNSTIAGSEIKQGTTLFTITGGDLAEDNIDAKYKKAKNNFEKAKTDYDRATELVKDKIISQKDFQQTKIGFENAKTAFNTIAKNYSENGQTISSAMNGFVKNIYVTEGQYVTTGTPLATVSKNKKLILQANVSQKYFNKLPTITSANFRTTGSEKVFSTTQLNGKIISYGKSATANSPFLSVTFEIDNSENLIPGTAAEVYLKSIPIPHALVIPASSLIEEQGVFFVFVQTGGESFQKRELKTGASDGINVQVLSGLNEGERIVTKGAYQIKLSSASGTLPAHGHEH